MNKTIEIIEINISIKKTNDKEELLLFRELIANKNELAKIENIIAPM